MDCFNNCPYKDQINKNTEDITTLDKEMTVKVEVQDNKYSTIIDLLSDIKASNLDNDRRLRDLEKNQVVNDYKTKKNTNWIESITIPKIITIIVGIITILGFYNSMVN